MGGRADPSDWAITPVTKHKPLLNAEQLVCLEEVSPYTAFSKVYTGYLQNFRRYGESGHYNLFEGWDTSK
jgi:hypothetical protein